MDRSHTDVWSLLDPSLSPIDGDMTMYLRRVLDLCASWFGASGASAFLSEGSVYKLAAQHGSDSAIPLDATVVPGQGIAGACIEVGVPLLVSDPRVEPSLSGKVRRVRVDLASAMVIPLMVPRQGCIGVLNLSRRNGLPCFTEDDLARASAVAHQIGLAVGHARLLAETQAGREKLQSIIDAVKIAVLVMDQEGDLEEANDAACELLAKEEDSPGWLDEIMHCPGALRKRVFDSSDGKTWWVSRVPTPSGVVITAEDVTDHERELQEASRLRRLAEIGQMTAAIAHEIRNPLTGIRSAAQMMGEAPERAGEWAEMIEEEAMKLNRLCDEFLEFARPLSVQPKDMNLHDLARKVVRCLTPEFDDAEIAFEAVFSGQAPTMHADPLRVEQVMRNLLRNALQACARGGKVLLKVGSVGFEVQDDGHGMPKDTVDRLFTPFFTTKAKGTGLGLSNVKKIVDAHGGYIHVSSELGRGTRFVVNFSGEKAA